MSAGTPANAARSTEPVSAPPKPSLLFFFDPRSGRSRRVEGFLAQVLQHRRNHDTFRLYRIDATQHTDLATKFKVGTVPTLVVVENKQVKARFQQPRGARELTHFLQSWLWLRATPPHRS